MLSIALLAASLASTQPASNCHAGQDYHGPAARSWPVHISLPLTHLSTGLYPAQTSQIQALDAAAVQFTPFAPQWSLAVMGADGAYWNHGQADVRFHAGSIGKSMTAAMIFQLIEEGRLSLTDTLDQWRPDLPNAELVTIDHLLTHRSGYFVHQNPERTPARGVYQSPETAFDRLHDDGTLFCPGTNWAYSNVSYMILGRIIAQLDDRSYEDSLQARILGPVGLEQTHILHPNTPDTAMPRGHIQGEAVGDYDYAGPYAAAPVSTTATDLIVWWRALLSGAVISAQSLDQMTTQYWPLFGDPQMGYGRGLQIGDRTDGPGFVVMHSGGVEGFTATVAWLADYDVFVAVMTNEQTVPAEAALWALVQALEADAPASP